jgi:parallel beta-helix repeat protein
MLQIHGAITMKIQKTQLLILLIFSSVFFIFTALPLKTSGQQSLTVRNQNTGREYKTIQEAINAANMGDTIYVENSMYYENVVVNKTVSLIGENRSSTVIDGGRETVIHVTADHVSIKGFTIQNGGWTFSQSGVFVDHSSGCKISGSTVRNCLCGIYLDSSRENSVLNNTISGNSYGIRLVFATENLVSGNDISNNTNTGTWISYSINNVFSGNNVSSNTVYAFSVSACTDNTFSSNRVSKNTYGIYLTASTNNDLFDNNISYNEQGLYFSASSYNTISGNNISSNTVYGVWFGASSNNVFLNNYAVNNWNSIYFTTSDNNIIYHNNFINTEANTTQQPICGGSENFWDNGVEGNYWSNLNGSDKNKDGISDTEYIIEGKNKDSYPLMATYAQFYMLVDNKMYAIDVVSNSTVSNFEYFYYAINRTTSIRFQAAKAGGKRFCRIRIPHAVIEPPYTVIVDHNASLYANIVHSNKTHSWLYFTYHNPEHAPTVISLLSQEQITWYQLLFWSTIGLAGVSITLFLLVIRYHRIFREQKRIIAAYELELEGGIHKHFENARTLFKEDVKRRKSGIKKFETKYNVKIRPHKDFENIIKRMGLKKKEKKKVSN